VIHGSRASLIALTILFVSSTPFLLAAPALAGGSANPCGQIYQFANSNGPSHTSAQVILNVTFSAPASVLVLGTVEHLGPIVNVHFRISDTATTVWDNESYANTTSSFVGTPSMSILFAANSTVAGTDLITLNASVPTATNSLFWLVGEVEGWCGLSTATPSNLSGWSPAATTNFTTFYANTTVNASGAGVAAEMVAAQVDGNPAAWVTNVGDAMVFNASTPGLGINGGQAADGEWSNVPATGAHNDSITFTVGNGGGSGGVAIAASYAGPTFVPSGGGGLVGSSQLFIALALAGFWALLFIAMVVWAWAFKRDTRKRR
jgi:hypothetical protein